MEPTIYGSGNGPIHGLSIRLDDGTVVSLAAVIAEGRRQRALELQRLMRAAFRGIGRAMRAFVSLVPGPESRRKIPTAMAVARDRSGHAFVPRTEDLLTRLGRAFFQTDVALGHVAGGYAEDVADEKRELKVKGMDDEHRLAA